MNRVRRTRSLLKLFGAGDTARRRTRFRLGSCEAGYDHRPEVGETQRDGQEVGLGSVGAKITWRYFSRYLHTDVREMPFPSIPCNYSGMPTRAADRRLHGITNAGISRRLPSDAATGVRYAGKWSLHGLILKPPRSARSATFHPSLVPLSHSFKDTRHASAVPKHGSTAVSASSSRVLCARFSGG